MTSHVTDAINITLGEQHWGQTSRGSGTVNKRLTNCEQIFEKNRMASNENSCKIGHNLIKCKHSKVYGNMKIQ